jgi:hypothetical protein
METKIADDLSTDGIRGFGKRVLRYFRISSKPTFAGNTHPAAE